MMMSDLHNIIEILRIYKLLISYFYINSLIFLTGFKVYIIIAFDFYSILILFAAVTFIKNKKKEK